MKLRFVVLFFLATIGKCSGKGGLEGLIEDVSVVSRLVNGIAIQSESLESERSIKTVVAELLDVRSAAFLSQLEKKEVETLKEDWSQFAEAVKKVPTISNDAVQESESGMGMISKLVEGKEILKGLEDGTFENPSQKITGLINNVDQTERKNMGDFSKYKITGLANSLDFIYGKSTDLLKKEEMESQLGSAKNDIDSCLDMINSDYENEFKNFLQLKNISKFLADVRNVAEMAELFLGKFDKIKSMESNWNTLSNGVSELNKVANFPKDLNKTSQSLVEVNQFMKSLAVQKAKKRYLTVGVPRGTEDLRRISEDLNGKFLKKVISEGKSLEGLKKALDPLNKFSEKMKSVEDQWKKVMASKEALEASEESGKMLGKLVEDGKNAPKNEDVGQSLSKAANCLNQLTKMTNDPDISGFTLMVDALETVENNVMAFETAMKGVREDINFTTAVAELNSLKSQLVDISTTSNIVEMWKNVAASKDLLMLTTFLRRTADKMSHLTGKELKFDELKNLSAIETVMKSFDGTNLVGALSCLDQESVDFTKIKALLGIGQVVAELNTKAKTMEDTNDYLKEVSQLKKQLAEISKSTWNIGRARRATGNKLRKLKNARELSRDLGRGLEVMREFSNIQAKQQNVLNAVNCPAEVKSLVDEMPGALDTWGEEQQQLMLALLKDLKKFDDSVTRMPRQDMLHISAVFEEANKVQGVDIDSSFFADPVSSDLSTTQFKSVAADYEQLSHLDLNFAQHHTYLKAASMSLSPLQSYFDTFFGIDRRPKKDKQVTVKESDFATTVLIAIAVVFGVALIAAPIVYYVRKYAAKKYRWINRERYWAHLIFLMGPANTWNLLSAVYNEKIEQVRNKLQERHFPNIYNFTTSLLHIAIITANDKILELLIQNGADREMMDDRRVTAEQFLKNEAKSTKNKDHKAKLKKCQKVFDKYRNKTFRPPINDLIPFEQYVVTLLCDEGVTKDFRAEFPGLIHYEFSNLVTHVVVDVDKNGVYDMDKALKKGDTRCYSAVFSSAMLIKSSWVEACVQSKKNFHKDYDYRVTKVRFNKKEFATVDEWKKWQSARALSALTAVTFCVNHLGSTFENTKVNEFVQCFETDTVENDELERLIMRNEPAFEAPYWFPDKKAIFVLHDEQMENKQHMLTTLETPHINEMVTIMGIGELCEMLLSQNGWGKLEKELAKRDKKQAKEASSSATVSRTSEVSIASEVSKTSQVSKVATVSEASTINKTSQVSKTSEVSKGPTVSKASGGKEKKPKKK